MKTIEEILLALTNPDRKIRWQAVNELKKHTIKDEETIRNLVELYSTEKSPSIRGVYVNIFKSIGQSAVIPFREVLNKQVKSSEGYKSLVKVLYLLNITDEALLREILLFALTDDEDAESLGLIIGTLYDDPQTEIVREWLLGETKNLDPAIRKRAAEFLAMENIRSNPDVYANFLERKRARASQKKIS
jgi:HEAT repeat protein